jgi:hypothetical protein
MFHITLTIRVLTLLKSIIKGLRFELNDCAGAGVFVFFSYLRCGHCSASVGLDWISLCQKNSLV